ncbi:MAG: hypothetical protein AAGE80_10540 [Pseudomonadota bacterium]
MRLTAPLFPAGQEWVLVDADPELLASVEPVAGVVFKTRLADLMLDLEDLLSPDLDLLTCSALLDLCSAAWLERLADALVRHRLPFYAVLNYDGREVWEPRHPSDPAALAAFHADQRRDKGFGPALGPDAHREIVRMLRERGFEVIEGSSDWDLQQPGDGPLIEALAEGSASVSNDRDWLSARRGAERVMIGHQDLFARPQSGTG